MNEEDNGVECGGGRVSTKDYFRYYRDVSTCGHYKTQEEVDEATERQILENREMVEWLSDRSR